MRLIPVLAFFALSLGLVQPGHAAAPACPAGLVTANSWEGASPASGKSLPCCPSWGYRFPSGLLGAGRMAKSADGHWQCWGPIGGLQCSNGGYLNSTWLKCTKYAMAGGITLLSPTCPQGLYLQMDYKTCMGQVDFSCAKGFVKGTGNLAQYCISGTNPANYNAPRGAIVCPEGSANEGNICIKRVAPSCPAPYSLDSSQKACTNVVDASCPAGSKLFQMPDGPSCLKMVDPVCPAGLQLSPDGGGCN